MRHLFVGSTVVLLAASAFGADTLPASAPKWTDISAETIASLEKDGKKIGYPGKAAGITCDPVTGNVYMIIPDQGIYLSTDHAATFTRADAKTIGGRCETGATLQMDPAGKRLACFMLDGLAGMTLDSGKTFTSFAGNGRGWDYAAVDWSAEKPGTILAMHHESGGQLFLSSDGGKTWVKNAKDAKFSAVGVFDGKTFVAAKTTGGGGNGGGGGGGAGAGIFRTTDAGGTWAQVSDVAVSSHVAAIYHKTAYLIGKEGLLTSKDQGVTWTKSGAAVEATFGPIFKDEKQMIVWGKKGIYETKDAGGTWNLVLTFPAEYNKSNPEWFNNLGWDPATDTFYVSHMGLAAYRCTR